MRESMMVLAALVAVPATAHTVDPSLLQKVEIHCDETGASERMKALLMTVLDESLPRFDNLNPLVSEKLRSRLRSRQLVLECGGREELDANDNAADSRRGFLRPFRIRMGVTAAGIRADDALKNTLLHELLHYAKIDNFSSRAHNDLEPEEYSEDNVYACAEAVYPDMMKHNVARTMEAFETCRTALGAGDVEEISAGETGK